MAKMKQLMLDIIDSQESNEELGEFVFPDYPIYPTKTAIFDDSEFENAEVSSD